MTLNAALLRDVDHGLHQDRRDSRAPIIRMNGNPPHVAFIHHDLHVDVADHFIVADSNDHRHSLIKFDVVHDRFFQPWLRERLQFNFFNIVRVS